ncbi:hypothetical protein GCM10010417_47900 [Streptomyces carpaticus]
MEEGAGFLQGVEAEADGSAAFAAEEGVVAAAGGQDPAVARVVVRPPPIDRSRVGDIVQDNQPPPIGRRQPREEYLGCIADVPRSTSGKVKQPTASAWAVRIWSGLLAFAHTRTSSPSLASRNSRAR